MPVSGASVLLQISGVSKQLETKTDAQGKFAFPSLTAGTYVLRVQKSGFRDASAESITLPLGETKHLQVDLQPAGTAQPTSDTSRPPPEAMQFDDKTDFTIAGISDSTAAGGHGSDANLRTSEALARDTRGLESKGTTEHPSSAPATNESEANLRAALALTPSSFEANHDLGELYFRSHRDREAVPLLEAADRLNPKDYTNAYDLALAYEETGDLQQARLRVQSMLTGDDRAQLHLLLGDIDERLNDPLSAVREYERSALLDPNEQSYFEWATELLIHGAVQPAIEIFTKGVRAYPTSEKMLAGLGAALYARGSFEEAAQQLCAASDLQPADPIPYLFLGKMEQAAPDPLACVEQRLRRFARDQPENAQANYYYAMALRKRNPSLSDSATSRQLQSLLDKAVSIDGKLAEAYLQLGIVRAEQGDLANAVEAYKRAVEADPNLAEAHFRLARAYRQMGDSLKATQELEAHARIRKLEATEVDQQRREVQHFLIVLKQQPKDETVR
jgi:tetratricopeptide (TPR) repeat protein